MTNEEIWIGEDNVRRQLKGDELTAFLKVREEIANIRKEEEYQTAIKAEAKAGLLARLGITAEEAELLIA